MATAGSPGYPVEGWHRMSPPFAPQSDYPSVGKAAPSGGMLPPSSIPKDHYLQFLMHTTSEGQPAATLDSILQASFASVDFMDGADMEQESMRERLPSCLMDELDLEGFW